jgi:hypothetical protein
MKICQLSCCLFITLYNGVFNPSKSALRVDLFLQAYNLLEYVLAYLSIVLSINNMPQHYLITR